MVLLIRLLVSLLLSLAGATRIIGYTDSKAPQGQGRTHWLLILEEKVASVLHLVVLYHFVVEASLCGCCSSDQLRVVIHSQYGFFSAFHKYELLHLDGDLREQTVTLL